MTIEFAGTRGDTIPSRVEAAAPLSLPWRLSDFARLVWIEVIGLIGVVICWLGCAHTVKWNEQLIWLAGSIGAMMVAGSGWITWALLGTRSLRARQRRLAQVLSSAVPQRTEAAVVGAALVASPAMTRFHLIGCPLAAGKQVRAASRVEHEEAGRLPCGVCCQ